jgi:diacylglycerol kinase (ATP)
MPVTPRRVTLIHNKAAGNRRHSASELTSTIAAAGYAVRYFGAGNDDIAAAASEPADLIAVAGGDGTVRKTAALARRGSPSLAILPLGGANNIATSLGIAGEIEEVIAGWRESRPREFFPIAAETPWGRLRLIEGVGLGLLAQGIEKMRQRKPPPPQARWQFADLVLRSEPDALDVTVDDTPLTGAFTLFEVTAIPLVGPNLRLAPAANPSDRLLDLCFAGAAQEERERLSRWLAAMDADTPAPLASRRARRLTISGRFQRIRIDDDVRLDPDAAAGSITLETASEPLCFLVRD